MRDGARLSASGGDIHHGAWRLGTFGRSVGSLLPIVATGRRYLYACKLKGVVRHPAAAGTQVELYNELDCTKENRPRCRRRARSVA
jgi:hypothetical protein